MKKITVTIKLVFHSEDSDKETIAERVGLILEEKINNEEVMEDAKTKIEDADEDFEDDDEED